ncbi:MAG: DUF3592 domain-containing protein [Polyangiaceae bacterium]
MKTRLRYFALFAFAIVPLLEVGEVKPLPLSLIAGVFLIQATLAFGTRRREHSLPRDILSALLLFGCFEASGIFVVTSLAMRVAPPVTPDGHHVMALGQALTGIVMGGALGALVSFFAALRPSLRCRRLERRLLHGMGAALVGAAIVTDLDLDAKARRLLFSYSLAFGLAAWCLSTYSMAKRARAWPSAKGTILSSVVEVDEGATQIHVVYEFEVRGVVRRRTRLRFGNEPFYRQRTIDEVSERYRVGASVLVFFDPAAPDNCTLELSFDWLSWVPVILFALIIILGCIFDFGRGY